MNGFETRVVVLVGIPGSGKSTNARSILNYFQCSDTSLHVKLIEYDSITKLLASENKNGISWINDIQAWRDTRSHALQLLTDHFMEMQQLSKEVGSSTNNVPKSLVVMDDNFHLRSMRREVYQVCQDFVSQDISSGATIGLTFVHFDLSLKKCLSNNEKRKGTEQYIPEETIIKISQTLEPPDPLHTSFESVSFKTSLYQNESEQLLTHNMYQTLHEMTLESIRKYQIQPLRLKSQEEIEVERRITRMSKVHQTDLILRLCVGNSCKEDKSVATIANEVRRDIISYCKNESTVLPNMDTLELWVVRKYRSMLDERINAVQVNGPANIN